MNLNFSPSPFELKKRGILDELRSVKKEILDLTISSPMQAGLVFDIADDLRYLAENLEWQFSAPDACGQLYAREAIAEYTGSGYDNIFVTSGSSESYLALFRLLCKKGDYILTPNPGYPLLDALADIVDLRCHPYFLKQDGKNWQIDIDSFYSAPNNAKIFLLIAPHNPTGHIPSQKEFEQVLQFCDERNLALIIDEVFSAYCLNQSSQKFQSFQNKVPVFLLDGLSKSVGLPHIKVGWIRTEGNFKNFDALEYILDASLSCSYLSQALCTKVLPRAREFQKKVIERLKTNQTFWCNYFSKMDAKIIPSAGGWYQSFYFPNTDDEELCLTLLKEKQILTHPGFLFDFEDGWLVASLLFY
jgi:aspartate/methionine/tyrosine aminotransferase